MLDKMKAVESRYEELNLLLSESTVMSNQDRYRRLAQEHAELVPLINDYRELLIIEPEIECSRA